MLQQSTYLVREEQGVIQVCMFINGLREINVALILSTQPLTAIGKYHAQNCYLVHNNYNDIITLTTLYIAVADFDPITGTEIIFSPTETEECVDISVTNDNLFEDTETFRIFVNPADSNLLTVSLDQAIVTIISDDRKC